MTGEQFKIEVVPLKNKLYRFAKRFVDDHEDAQDIVQEVFIKMWSRRDQLDEYRSVEALAMVTTRNMCLDRIKARKYATEDIEKLTTQPDHDSREELSEQSEMIGKIHRIIRTLPELQQSVMHLRDVEGYEFDKIADVLEMNENAVRVNLSRARKRVREILLTEKSHEYQRR